MLELPEPKEYTPREVGMALTSMNNNLIQFMEQNTKEHETVIKKQDHTNGRVRKLEKFVYSIMGALAVLSWQVTNFEKIKQVVVALVK